MPHPLVARVRAALGAIGPLEAAYLDLLARRLAGLAASLEGPDWRDPPGARALARRFLAPRIGGWHDGDENLVREQLGDWGAHQAGGAGAARRDTARRLLAAAAQLAGLEARRETLFCYLWQMEALLQNPRRKG